MSRIIDPEEREIEVLQDLVSFQGKDVLDLGCGDGRTARRIAREAASVIGVDPDEERIALALQAVASEDPGNLTFRAEDAVTLEFPEASFDTVIFTRSL